MMETHHYMRRASPLFFCVFLLTGCWHPKHETTLIESRVIPPSVETKNGKHELMLGDSLFINRGYYWRDGYFYIPKTYQKNKALPLVIWLHGGGGDSSDADHMMKIADKHEIVLLSLDSRHNTWDGIDSTFGPDVRFIDKAMQHVFERVAINPSKVVLAGLSDGGSYALALGRANGEVFTHLAAVAPWRLSPPSPRVGQPKIFLAHGTKDNVYPIFFTRQFIKPSLEKEGYELEYFEFDAAHWATEPMVQKMFAWVNET